VSTGAPAPYQAGNELHAVDPSFRDYYQRALLADRLGALFPFRIMLNEYYMVTGRFPRDEQEFIAEFGEGSLAADEDFVRLSVLEHGGIRADLAPPFEAGAYVSLVPEVSKRGSMIKWQCGTNLPQSALGPRSAAPCESVGGAEAPIGGDE
jgi:hypothetical protein